MVERIFIVESSELRLDAAAARRQFSLSIAVGFAVLAVAAIVQFQPAHWAPSAAPTHLRHAPVGEFALGSSTLDRN